MQTLCVAADRPVDPLTIEVLQSLESAAATLSIPFFVAGARARDLVLHHVFGYDIVRATRDLDLAVHVASWDQFAALKQHLLLSPRFAAAREMQELRYDSILRIDLLPFGGVTDSQGRIAWPPTNDVVLSMEGYPEALKHAVTVQIDASLAVPVASLASLAALKLIAWVERGASDRKDALDLGLLLLKYGEVLADEIYVGPAMERFDYDVLRAGAYKLGQHARENLGPASWSRLQAALAQPKRPERLAIHVADAYRHVDEPLDLAEVLLADFSAGAGTESP